MGRRAITPPSGRTLDVGCGKNKAPGAVGFDIKIKGHTDVVGDLGHFPYPFKAGSFDRFVSKQVLEHFDHPLTILDELHRLAKPRAEVVIEVPHFSCHYMFRSLHHRRFWSFFSLDTYVRESGKFRYQLRRITFHRAYRRWGIQWLANRFPLSYERFWAFVLPAEHLHIELKAVKDEVT